MADTPFGLSFGSPKQFMGSSGVGPAIKTGLLAYGMQKSGLTDWLNNLNKKQPNIPGSVAPFTAISDQGQLPAIPQAPADMDWGTMVGAVPPAPMAQPEVMQQVPVEPAQPNPQELGLDWLNGKLSSNYVNPQASRDIPVAQGGGYTEQLGSGNDYKNVPGYGKLQKVAQAFMGLG